MQQALAPYGFSDVSNVVIISREFPFVNRKNEIITHALFLPALGEINNRAGHF